MKSNVVINGDSLEILKQYPDNFFDSVVTDPPYGLGKEPNPVDVMKDWISTGCHEVKSKGGFMGKEWDSFVPQPNLWKEVLRVLKPGGHALVFTGTRTQDWMAMSLRFAGFEIRDSIAYWSYASGFPKSTNISKQIEKKDKELAKQYEGLGTALKPSCEPIIMARKPLSEKTLADNCLKWGTGGINIDGCRIKKQPGDRTEYGIDGIERKTGTVYGTQSGIREFDGTVGRWPANTIFSHHEDCELVSEGTINDGGITKSGKVKEDKESYAGESNTKMLRGKSTSENQHGDSGGASRFFYVAKASRKEREEGLEHLPTKTLNRVNSGGLEHEPRFAPVQVKNNHATVKPIKLMQYLVRLVTPKGGTVLDPFGGSGTTGIAAVKENFGYVLIELDKDFCEIAEARIKHFALT